VFGHERLPGNPVAQRGGASAVARANRLGRRNWPVPDDRRIGRHGDGPATARDARPCTGRAGRRGLAVSQLLADDGAHGRGRARRAGVLSNHPVQPSRTGPLSVTAALREKEPRDHGTMPAGTGPAVRPVPNVKTRPPTGSAAPTCLFLQRTLERACRPARGARGVADATEATPAQIELAWSNPQPAVKTMPRSRRQQRQTTEA